MFRTLSSIGTSDLAGEDLQESGRRLVVLDPFDGVNANLVSTGEWARNLGTAVIGEDGSVAYSSSAMSSAFYVNTKNGMRYNRWIRCLVTSMLNNVQVGVVLWSNATSSQRIYVQVVNNATTSLDNIILVERYLGLDIITTIGNLAPNGGQRLITASIVGRDIRVDIDNGALVLEQNLSSTPSIPNGQCGLYYNNTGLSVGHAAEWDDFEVRLYPYFLGD